MSSVGAFKVKYCMAGLGNMNPLTSFDVLFILENLILS
jgi:hypothetical protein